MLISDQPVGSGKVLISTPRAKVTQPSERHTLQTGNIATKMARDDSKTLSSKKLIIALVVVAIAVVMIVCMLVWLNRRRKRKG